MGDRCYLRMEVLARDQEELDRIAEEMRDYFYDVECDELRGPIVELEVDEANYAYWDEREDWAAKGFIFRGHHGSGGDYGEGEFIAIDGKHYAVECLHSYSGPVCLIDVKTRKPDPNFMERINEYLDALEKVEAIFKPLEPEETAHAETANIADKDQGEAGSPVVHD